jgi:toxin FitB
MGYLIDTNALSELRKPHCEPRLKLWFAAAAPEDLFLSVLVLGEIRHGAEACRRKDPVQAASLDAWITKVETDYTGRILPVTREIADYWGRLGVPDKVPVIDGLLAATALFHRLTLVTRNTRDVVRTGAALFNPFEPAAMIARG